MVLRVFKRNILLNPLYNRVPSHQTATPLCIRSRNLRDWTTKAVTYSCYITLPKTGTYYSLRHYVKWSEKMKGPISEVTQ